MDTWIIPWFAWGFNMFQPQKVVQDFFRPQTIPCVTTWLHGMGRITILYIVWDHELSSIIMDYHKPTVNPPWSPAVFAHCVRDIFQISPKKSVRDVPRFIPKFLSDSYWCSLGNDHKRSYTSTAHPQAVNFRLTGAVFISSREEISGLRQPGANRPNFTCETVFRCQSRWKGLGRRTWGLP